VPADRAKRGHYFVVLKENQPLTLEAAALSFADPWTLREQVVVAGARHGDREERRTLECSTELVPYLAQAERLDVAEGEAGTIAGWSGLAQICRIHREVQYLNSPWLKPGGSRDQRGRRIEHRASGIEHRASGIGHRASAPAPTGSALRDGGVPAEADDEIRVSQTEEAALSPA